jgi:cell division protein FtsQ
MEQGNNVQGKRYEKVNIPSLENTLNQMPAIENAEVSVALNGEVVIRIKEREPLIRVITAHQESYYIDRTGKLMPLSDRYTANVLIATGNIYDRYAWRYKLNISDIKKDSLLVKKSLLDDLYDLAAYIDKDPFFKEQVEQVYINEQGDIELVPKIGDQRIIFGNTQYIEKKFKKLKLFYTEGLNKTDGWNLYSVINLKYKDQVVCTRKGKAENTPKKAAEPEESITGEGQEKKEKSQVTQALPPAADKPKESVITPQRKGKSETALKEKKKKVKKEEPKKKKSSTKTDNSHKQ